MDESTAIKRTLATMGLALTAGLAIPAQAQDLTAATAEKVPGANPHEFGRVGRPHLLPLREPAAIRAAAAAAEADSLMNATIPNAVNRRALTYYGGPVMQNVRVLPIYWNSRVQFQSNLNAFYSALSSGSYMAFLSQYGTSVPKQTIGNGSAAAGLVDSQALTSVTDAAIQAYLFNAFRVGKLPQPSPNNLYMIHFPSGTQITDAGGAKSCVQFCAYHGTARYNNVLVQYGVLPDLSQAGCSSGCGSSTVLNNTTSVASHEFAEAVTDPAIGLATTTAAPLAWYNATYGEIGDICNGQQASMVLSDGRTYVVQKEWSNSASACVVPSATFAAAAPTYALAATSVSLAAEDKAGTTVTLTNWTEAETPLQLSASGQPAGMSIRFSPSTVPLRASGSVLSAMTISTAGTPAGRYVITIHATDGASSADTSVLVSVK